MADLAQLERALRNADAAGDVEAARTIAAAIREQRSGSTVGNLLAGAVRGAGSIGATLLAPVDAAARALGVQNSVIGRTDRRQAMDEALQGLGANTDSTAYGVGKLGAEVAGTMGVGGGLANVIGRIPGAAAAAPNLLQAVGTAGMKAGTGGMLTRAAGGGITGAAGAGLVDPGEAGTGAVVGAALPGAIKVVGLGANAAGRALRGDQARSGELLGKALGLENPADIAAAVQRLQAAQELVPGSRPTVAQALQTPQAGILQRVVGDSAGGGALRDALAQQNAARLAALEGVAPTVATGFRSAQQDMGEALSRFAVAGDKAAKARTSELFNAVPLDDARFYLPLDEMRGVANKYFGAGSFGDRAGVDQALKVANEIGTLQLPAVKATQAGAAPSSLAQAVRKAGGLSLSQNDGLRGELLGLRGDLKNLVRTNGGLSPGRMAEKMAEAGYIPDEDAGTLFAALRQDAMGQAQFSTGDDLSRQFSAMRDAAMGDAPAAEMLPKMASLREVQNLRSSIGNAQRQAAQSGNDQAAAALGQMKQAIDDKINQVVRGDGLPGEDLPIAWADKLSEGFASKRAQVEQFRTGPQAAIFRKGADGQPVVQGGEVAAKFWGSRPGVADDVAALRKLIADEPRLLGQFRSMVTTEGASTADAGGKLTSKFVKWVDGTLPGLQKAFEPEQVAALQRIADDIRRAEGAAAAGMSRGSNTYQNAQNALNLGLLDSPLLNAAANRIPLLGSFAGPALQGLRQTARESRAGLLAGLLSDSQVAARALTNPAPAQGLLSRFGDQALPWLYLTAPGLVGGR